MYLYWIHLPEHCDVMSQGYVGITHDFEQRMFAHKSCAKTGKDATLYKAIRKYGWDYLIKEILVISGESYCKDLEKKFRPTARIAWNIAIGGDAGGTHMRGIKQSAKHIFNRQQALIGRISGFEGKKHTKESIEKTMKFVRGIPKNEATKQKIAKAHMKRIKVNGIVYQSWIEASRATGIPTGSISYLLKGKIPSKKWAGFKLEAVM